MAKNFLVFKVEQLQKMNAQRRALSQPDIYAVPIPTKGQVLFVPAAHMNSEPASCYNCVFYNYGRNCQKIGERVPIRKFIYPKRSADATPIEYWPKCAAHDYGEPNYGEEKFISSGDPQNMALGWINAPKPGLELSGGNCSGVNDGDDCDHYCTKGGDKRAEPEAFCRVLQTTVQGGDVCSHWQDDDWMDNARAQAIMSELDG